jgi:hypothetical protein
MGMKNRQAEKARDRVIRQRRALMLLATEGDNKTEELYFSKFKSTQKKYAIHFVPGNFTDPKSMVESIRRYAKKMDFGKADDGDRAFCILDLDVDNDRATTIRDILQDPPVKGLDFTISNPCFEVWYFCHFEYSTKIFMNSDAVIKQLKKVLPSYSKGQSIYAQIENQTTNAIANARKLDDYHVSLGRRRCDTAANPTTEAYKVVELLRTAYSDIS